MPVSESLSDIDVGSRQKGMTHSALQCPLVTVEVINHFNTEIAERIDLGNASQELLDAIEREREEVERLCGVDTALGLVWATYAACWFELKGWCWEALNDQVVYVGKGYEPSESWLQIMYGACRHVWDSRAQLGHVNPHLPRLGSLLSAEISEDCWKREGIA